VTSVRTPYPSSLHMPIVHLTAAPLCMVNTLATKIQTLACMSKQETASVSRRVCIALGRHSSDYVCLTMAAGV